MPLFAVVSMYFLVSLIFLSYNFISFFTQAYYQERSLVTKPEALNKHATSVTAVSQKARLQDLVPEDRLLAYIKNARQAVNGTATFPLEGNLCNKPGFIGQNPFGDGYGTGIPWSGMAIIGLAKDGSFFVTIAWRPSPLGESYYFIQEKEMRSVKEFFESATT